MKRGLCALLMALIAAAQPACESTASKPDEVPAEAPSPQDEAFDALLAFENEARRTTDFTAQTPANRATGPNPYDIVSLPGGRFAALLRGADALLILDPALNILQRLPAPASPVSMAFVSETVLAVAGESAAEIALFDVKEGAASRLGAISLPGTPVIRDLAFANGTLYAVDERSGAVKAMTLNLKGAKGPEITAEKTLGHCLGPVQIEHAGTFVGVNCLLDRSLLIWTLDDAGLPTSPKPHRITHDGPFWSLALAAKGDVLWIAGGGVEDHALDRGDGAFGYVDSFVTLYRFEKGAHTRQAAVNVSEHGVVTPRWLKLLPKSSHHSIVVAGYGADKVAILDLVEEGPKAETFDAVPGITAMAQRKGGGYVAVSPLLDAFAVVGSGADVSVVPLEARGPQTVESRVGEALFFTNLMAPWNETAQHKSRFTCETCHFEGYIDGRVHFTGRGEVHAATKPLRGLFNNRPHFSRALDRSMARMVFNEFKVANKNNGRSPWFEVTRKEAPWLAHIEGVPESLDPVFLRRSLMRFLMDFTHRPNPAVRGRETFSKLEAQGASVFAARCEGCHSALLVTDAPGSKVASESWESLIFSAQGPIVWASAPYHKTGVEPYVHSEGARTPSLRRLYKKRPYFTNGTAPTVRSVLERARFGPGDAFSHDKGKAGTALTEPEIDALVAFLDLL